MVNPKKEIEYLSSNSIKSKKTTTKNFTDHRFFERFINLSNQIF